MICKIVPWVVRLPGFSKLIWLMIPATLVVFVDGFARWVGREYEFAMAIEHVLQMGTPILFLMAFRKQELSQTWFHLATILAAMTFLGHALYAIGFHTVTLNFKLMTQGLLGIGEKGSIVFLAVVGWLDIVAAVGVFIKPARIPSLLYMIVWGGLTALARVVLTSTRLRILLVWTPGWWKRWCVPLTG